MKAEKEMSVPINLLSGFAVCTANGKSANAMTENEWEEFYNALSKHLRRYYPGLYDSLFSPSGPTSEEPRYGLGSHAPRAREWVTKRVNAR
jgi:hypothetical protein